MIRRLLLALVLVVSQLSFASSYDTLVLSDRPVMYLPLSAPHGAATEPNLAGPGLAGRYVGAPSKARMPNGDYVALFNGTSQYVEVADAAALSIPQNGALTLEAWIRPATLEFPRPEGSGYVHWAGKGVPGQHEYACRMYSYTNTESRPNRISGYVFNLAGGLGSGSYFQDPVRVGEWIHVAVVMDDRAGTVSIYKNGILRDTTPLDQFDVTPQPGTAPLRIATRDLRSYFHGAIGKFALYHYAVPQTRLRAHYMKIRIWR